MQNQPPGAFLMTTSKDLPPRTAYLLADLITLHTPSYMHHFVQFSHWICPTESRIKNSFSNWEIFQFEKMKNNQLSVKLNYKQLQLKSFKLRLIVCLQVINVINCFSHWGSINSITAGVFQQQRRSVVWLAGLACAWSLEETTSAASPLGGAVGGGNMWSKLQRNQLHSCHR